MCDCTSDQTSSIGLQYSHTVQEGAPRWSVWLADMGTLWPTRCQRSIPLSSVCCWKHVACNCLQKSSSSCSQRKRVMWIHTIPFRHGPYSHTSSTRSWFRDLLYTKLFRCFQDVRLPGERHWVLSAVCHASLSPLKICSIIRVDLRGWVPGTLLSPGGLWLGASGAHPDPERSSCSPSGPGDSPAPDWNTTEHSHPQINTRHLVDAVQRVSDEPERIQPLTVV